MEFSKGLEGVVNTSENHEQVSNNQAYKQGSLRYIPIEPSMYLKMFEDAKKDMTKLIPWKDIFTLRKNQMGSLLGYTYLGSRMLVKQEPADLQDMDGEVNIHEHVHTDSEYETRVITAAILGKDKVAEYVEKTARVIYGGDNRHFTN